MAVCPPPTDVAPNEMMLTDGAEHAPSHWGSQRAARTRGQAPWCPIVSPDCAARVNVEQRSEVAREQCHLLLLRDVFATRQGVEEALLVLIDRACAT
jgi:hypothetical protein